MKYVDEFRDRDKAFALVREIETLAGTIGATRQRPIQIMEVCGGHTHSIFRYGIEPSLRPADGPYRRLYRHRRAAAGDFDDVR
jgi:hydrogenase expression/formation protein HypD